MHSCTKNIPFTTGYFNTGFIPFFKNKFSELFQDSEFSKTLKFTLPFHSQYLNVNYPYCQLDITYFLLELNRFPELSRTSSLFPGLFRFSRIHMNPVIIGVSWVPVPEYTSVGTFPLYNHTKRHSVQSILFFDPISLLWASM